MSALASGESWFREPGSGEAESAFQPSSWLAAAGSRKGLSSPWALPSRSTSRCCGRAFLLYFREELTIVLATASSDAVLPLLGILLVTSKGAHGVPGSAIVIPAATLNVVQAIPAIGLEQRAIKRGRLVAQSCSQKQRAKAACVNASSRTPL